MLRLPCFILVFALLPLGAVAADEVDDALAAIAKVGAQGAGSDGAQAARQVLARHGVEIAPRLIAALDNPNIVAANWVRSAFDDLVTRELDRPDVRWPVEDLKKYVAEPTRQGRARRLVLELLERLEPAYRAEFIPTRLDDPEFRSEAVAAALAAGDSAAKDGNGETALRQFRAAFAHARDADQVLAAARKLTETGEAVDPVRRLGFVTRWRLLGPFDAPGTSGFDAHFPPEKEKAPDLAAGYDGQKGAKLAWKLSETNHPLGETNLMQAVAPAIEAVAYAAAELRSPREQVGEVRCSADDNISVWVNGQPVLARRQWLNGTRLDRFSAPVRFQEGTNHVLVKICNGPQHVNPEVPNNWTFQIRFCDATGAGLELENLLPVPEKKEGN